MTLAHEWAPLALRPELSRLVDVGMLARAARVDDGAQATAPFGAELARATRRGELTGGQAGALAALLGLSGAACHPANDA